ncbi:hypothetical protein ABU162_05050 [Paenibacillus thiaminolyticus]|uniref:hypothetical protein n=1 Tax=Paenibacillus thiaminolyticus TaxID=49283 RepID=UPI0035A6C088
MQQIFSLFFVSINPPPFRHSDMLIQARRNWIGILAGPEHAVYVQKISDQGNVLLGGPVADGSGGAVILDVENYLDYRHEK